MLSAIYISLSPACNERYTFFRTIVCKTKETVVILCSILQVAHDFVVVVPYHF